jgi:two-component system NtrC family sensor kinase
VTSAPGEVNCIFTKVLIPFVEREAGAEAAATICRAAGRPREWLMADHNWIPLALANELMRLGQELMGEPDEERWSRRFWEYGMDWKPREERSYLGTYTMGIGDPRTIYARQDVFHRQVLRWVRLEIVDMGRTRAVFRQVPLPGYRMPRWGCTWLKVALARYPTNWGLPRARVIESRCAVDGADACVLEVRWRNPSLGPWFWTPTLVGITGAGLLWTALHVGAPLPWTGHTALAALPALAGVAVGYGLRERQRRRHTQRLLDLQGEEIIYSNNELEKKFRELETKIEQLSLLTELTAAVNATLDPEKIYEQALTRLVHGMRYQAAYFFVVDRPSRIVRGHKVAAGDPRAERLPERLEFPLDTEHSVVGKVAVTGIPLVINDMETTTEPIHRATVEQLGYRALLAMPFRVKNQVVGVLAVSSWDVAFTESDMELVAAVANHVALALDRAENFQTIEELSRGLEDKVRVRTDQLRVANEELATAYRDLQATQMQLIQREKMASVGQLVAGVAHELNNPIGFVSSNVTTLEEFVKRLRAMLEVYRAVPLATADRERVEGHWASLKVDYALKYLDSMILGIKEGAERTRKIVRDLRVFARSDDDVWQPVDLHEEIESSLTLLNHLLKDRVTVRRKFGELPSVECIRSQIDQVFLNLLANAAQAITGQGEITIETRHEDGTAVVSIADSGPGIAPDVLGRVFDPFFTTKPVGEGTGLGLSISYEIVKKHRGEVSAASPPGGGAIFTVRLPLARAA